MNAVRSGLIACIAIASGVGIVAQQAAVPSPPGVTRTILNQQDLAVPGYASALVRVELLPGAREGKHQHPGTLIGHVLEGVLTFEREGKPTLEFKAGDTFNVEPNTTHEGLNRGATTARLLVSFVFPKNQPMTVPVK